MNSFSQPGKIKSLALVVRLNDNDLAPSSHHPNPKSKITSLVIFNTNEDHSYYIYKRRELVEIELISGIQLTFTISSFSCCYAFEQVNRANEKSSINNLPLGKRDN